MIRNLLRGLKMPKEDSPQRPVLSVEQFKALRTAATQHSPTAERFVMLAWYTGHRSSAIRQLRWADVDLDGGTIRWRAETDKIAYEHRTAMHPELIAFLKQHRQSERAIGDAWLFPSPRRARRGKPLTREGGCKPWQQLATAAKLPKKERYGWHSCRRALVNALRDVPMREVKDLGGFKTTRTVVEVYQQADHEARRRALQRIATA